MKLIVFSGLPGAGKSAVAAFVAASLGIPLFAKDWLEAPLLSSQIVSRDQLGVIGYELLTTLARQQLLLGQSAILDSVASTSRIRKSWCELAREHDAEWLVIECICSDEAVHRGRLAQRRRTIPDWPELEWADVERVRGYFEPWFEDRLVLDSLEPISANVEKAIAYVQGTTT